MKRFAIAAVTVVASLAMAQEGTTETTSSMNSPIKIYSNVDLNMAKIDAGSESLDMGYSLVAGVDGVWMYDEAMGASIGLDFNMLQGKKNGTTVKNNYLDIPVNFAYNWAITSDVNSLIGIGPYFGIPMGKWKYTGTFSGDDKAKVAMGLNLESHTTFMMSSDFSLGGHIGFKYAFNDLSDLAETQNYWALGLGVSAKFL